jgi:hypothetical protein
MLRYLQACRRLFGAVFSAATVQLCACSRLLGAKFSATTVHLFGAKFSSAATVQLCRLHVIAFLGLGFWPPRFNFVHVVVFLGPGFRPPRFIFLEPGFRRPPRFNFVHVVVFLGPAFRPSRLRFVVDSLFWGQVRGRHGSTLSSACNRLFGASFSAATVQLCRLLVIAFLGPAFRPSRLRFVVDSLFWGQAFGRQDSGLSSTRFFGAR